MANNRAKAFEVDDDGIIINGGVWFSTGVAVPTHSAVNGDMYWRGGTGTEQLYRRESGVWVLKSFVGTGGNFGNEYQDAASEGVSSTGSPTFQNKLTLTTPVIPAGDYLSFWACELTHDQDAFETQHQFAIDDVEQNISRLAANDSNLRDEWLTKAGFKVSTLSNAVHTFKLNFRETNTGSAEIRRARITLWRVT